mgnify:CR=1 FL=1
MTYLGIDIGTSGIRACVIDAEGKVLALQEAAMAAPEDDDGGISQAPEIWWQSLQQVLDALFKQTDPADIAALAVDGTSGTLLLTDAEGQPLAPALMYNDASSGKEAALIETCAPADSAAHGASSGLAKLLALSARYPQAQHALHQADLIAARFSGRFDISDANNALKTGYDAVHQCWPDWLQQLPVKHELLPRVVAPGSVIGPVSPDAARRFGFSRDTRVVAGTTDSIAAFVATGADQPGMAVTSLGSTLAIKIISEQPVYAPEFGIYSHRLGDHWLAGGASNSGGAVLKQFFDNQQLNTLSRQIKPDQSSGLDYYPLPRPGERFPINDAQRQAKLTPRPDDDVRFLQGLLEGIGRIEKQAYDKLHQLGAPRPVSVATAGGGANNAPWLAMRQQMLGVPVFKAAHADACYGSALLACRAVSPA